MVRLAMTASGCGVSRGEYELFIEGLRDAPLDDTLRRMRALGQA